MSTDDVTITATLNLQQQLTVSGQARHGSPEQRAHLLATAQSMLGQQVLNSILDPLWQALSAANERAVVASTTNPWAASAVYRDALADVHMAVTSLGGWLLERVQYTYGDHPGRRVATLGAGDTLVYKGQTFVGPAVVWEPEPPEMSDTPHYRTPETGPEGATRQSLDDEAWTAPRPAPGTAQHLLWLRHQRELAEQRRRHQVELERFLAADGGPGPEGPRPDRAAAYDRATTPEPGAPRHD